MRQTILRRMDSHPNQNSGITRSLAGSSRLSLYAMQALVRRAHQIQETWQPGLVGLYAQNVKYPADGGNDQPHTLSMPLQALRTKKALCLEYSFTR